MEARFKLRRRGAPLWLLRDLLLAVEQGLAVVAAGLCMFDLILAGVASRLAPVELRLLLREADQLREVGWVSYRASPVLIGLIPLDRGLVDVGECCSRSATLWSRSAIACSCSSGGCPSDTRWDWWWVLMRSLSYRCDVSFPVARSSECLEWPWSGDVVALGEVDAELSQQIERLGVFHPLGHGL